MAGKRKILVVDDDEHIRDYFVAILSLEDRYEICSAGDGDEAIRTIESDPPDLVLLDFMMPRRNGIEVLREIKGQSQARPEFENVEFVMVTGKGDEGIAAAVVKAGAADYLRKPCPTERLLTTVEKVLEFGQVQLLQRKEQRRRLRMRKLVQRIMELTIEGFLLTDLNGRVSYANHKAAYILGLTGPSAVKDKSLGDLLGRKVQQVFEKRLAKGLDLERAGPPLRVRRRQQGQDVVLSFSLHSFEDEKGERVGVIVRFQDLLEVQKSLDDSLSSASREITRYFIPTRRPRSG